MNDIIKDNQRQQLDDLGRSKAKTRSAAINDREAEGIEQIWLEDQEYYEGVDDANRFSEARINWRQKPPGRSAGLKQNNTKSTVFPNITGPFCEAAASRVGDMLLSQNDMTFKITPHRNFDQEELAKGNFNKEEIQAAIQQGVITEEDAQAKVSAMIANAKERIRAGKTTAEKIQARISNWLLDCQWHAQMRTVIEDAARIGTGVIKGPVPIVTTNTIWKDGTLQKVSITNPGSKWVDPWNLYPDPACGENIHNGSYIWERDYVTRKQLRGLLFDPSYLGDQIHAVLKEGPIQAEGRYKETPEMDGDGAKKEKYEIWYYHGTVEKEDLEAAGCDCGEEEDPHVPAMITMVNNRVIRASLNPLDSGDFPYDVLVWRRRSGRWTGIGVARQIRVPQKIVTGGTRNLMDNAGIAAGPMIVFRQGAVTPINGVAEIAPRKVFIIAEDDESVVNANHAIGVIKVDMMVNELMQIIQLGMQLAQDTTGLPLLLQGQLKRAPDTVGGMAILDNNASSLLRRLAKLFDERMEPHIRRYYNWLLQYGEEMDEKGDFQVSARGSSALVERNIQNQELSMMSQVTLDPRFGLDPRKWAREFLKSRRFDPRRFEYDDEEWQAINEQMNQPEEPEQDNTLAEMQFKVEAAEKLQLMKQQHTEALKAMQLQHTAQQNERSRELTLYIEQMGHQIDSINSESDKEMNFDKIKAKLAEITIKLKMQEKLSGQMQVIEPEAEPIGRAKPGYAYSQ